MHACDTALRKRYILQQRRLPRQCRFPPYQYMGCSVIFCGDLDVV